MTAASNTEPTIEHSDRITAEIGVIGGSGFYALPGLTAVQHVHVPTPYGETSAPVVVGTLAGRRVAFIARHDVGHRLLPTELPAQANIYALKRLGVQRVLAVSAVGSLQEQYAPLHAVVPDQLIDRTRGRTSTFFGDGIVAHIGFADPFCAELADVLSAAAATADFTTHRGGTLVVIEGPAFSTRAESDLYRSWGAAIIGMTALPETKLAREAELCYATLCLVTDYDVWHPHAADVTADLVVANLQRNAERAGAALIAAIAAVPHTRACGCGDALRDALITPAALVPPETRARLGFLLTRYWGTPA